MIAATLPFAEERTPSILVVSHPSFQWIMHCSNSKNLFWAETQPRKLEHGGLRVSVHVRQKHEQNRLRYALLRRVEENPSKEFSSFTLLVCL